MTKRILVTGGFGFVGGHLVDYLTRRYPSFQVHVVDNLTSNPIPHEKLLEELGPRPGLSFDLVSIEEFCDRAPSGHWDQIYHLASVVGPAGVLKHSGRIVKMIVDDTYQLMDVAVRCGARLLDISTSEVYGGGQNGYCSEEFPKIIESKASARLEYAIGKLASETALINATSVSPLDAVIIRPFNIAGPRQSGVGGFVLPRFIALAMKNRPLTVFGSGEQIRAFTHMKDIVTGLVAAMERGKKGTAYNLGNPENRITINELAELVLKITGSKAGMVHVDPKIIYGSKYEEANDKYPNATRAFEDLAWIPEYSKDRVIEDAHEYMRTLDSDLCAHLAGKID